MEKLVPNVKVIDAGCYSRKQIKHMSIEQKKRLGLIMSNGGINQYRYNHYIGQGGFRTEKTWDKVRNKHDCCGSKVYWRHKVGCKPELPDDPDDLSDLKDI